MDKQQKKELIQEIKYSSIPVQSQEVLLKLVDESLVDTDNKSNTKTPLKIGDNVIMNNKYYVSDENKGKIFTVISEPEELAFIVAVYLDDCKRLYPVDGLSKVGK